MSDDTDDQTLLASVFLDNEATPDERALVETSPETLAEVASLGQVRTVLSATTTPPSISEREAHLAAALDVFERMSDVERSGEATPSTGVDAAAAAALTTPLSSSDTGRHRRPDRRSSSTWMLTAAAALLVLGGVGAVVSGVIGGQDDSTDVAESQDAVAADAANEAEVVEAMEADEVLGAESDELSAPTAEFDDNDAFSEGRDASAEATASDDAMEESAEVANEGEVAADDAGDTGLFDDEAEAPETVPPEAEVIPPPQQDDLTPLTNTDDLAAFATLAVNAVGPDGEIVVDDIDYEPLPGSCEERFGVQKRAGFADYNGEVVQVGIDLDNRIVYAYTERTCTVVAQTSLPDGLRDPAAPTSTQP